MGNRSGRKVLLAVRASQLDQRLLISARGLCQRMAAGLDILVLAGSDSLPVAITDFAREMRDAGVICTLTRMPELQRQDIVRYANTHECIVTVMIDSLAGWGADAPLKGDNPWRQLACPLVTVVPAKTKVDPRF
ncbi:MAG: hypothetical protein KKF85_04015 [Gammaproteobacteria bacterium]|nr:hypothetical protein [Rhodocyclaceae bacterium]MBU3908394.1 hypothetical protein [Gammaproteobacteria bacterium]MBU3988610.1 hypothetical protein [Gammaproteobacteria bacterium]MBU4004104.1 hypothetical protein [Gammaproteobacteria bacterium]MBU4020351.1 hypothetical protein [Gammaproteobacteria bacterium]